jgi:hypothetical protein
MQPAPTPSHPSTATLQVVYLDGSPASPELYKDRPVYVVKNYKGIESIIQANKDAGLFFFEKKTLAFFKSKIGTYLGYGVFITKETDPNGKTACTIRVALADGSVQTFGDFHSFAHARTAGACGKRLVRLLAEGKQVVFYNFTKWVLENENTNTEASERSNLLKVLLDEQDRLEQDLISGDIE